MIDSGEMKGGEKITEFIEQSIRKTDITLSIVSKNSLKSVWVAMETINTLYAEKVTEKLFLPCLIDQSFFSRDFTDDILDFIDYELNEIDKIIKERLKKDRGIKDLQEDRQRYRDLKHNLDNIVSRLRNSFCIDISGANFNEKITKIVERCKDFAGKNRKLNKNEECLQEIQQYFDDGHYKEASACAERLISIAQESRNIELEKKGHIRAVLSLDNYIISTRPKPRIYNQILSRILRHIDSLEKLGSKTVLISLLRAQLARLEHKPEEVIRFSKEAEIHSESLEDKAEAIVIHMQALWQLNQPEKVFEFEKKIMNLLQKLENLDSKFLLHGTWLRTICKAEKVAEKDVNQFVNSLRSQRTNDEFPARRILILIGEIASEFSRRNDLICCLILLDFANEIADEINDPGRMTNVNLQISEVHAELGNNNKAIEYLDKADNWLDQVKTELRGQTKEKWANLKATSLFTRGRVFKRLFEKEQTLEAEEPEKFLILAKHSFLEVKTFISDKAEHITGNVQEFSTEINWWLGRCNVELGCFLEAVHDFQKSRPLNIPKRHPLNERWVKAWQLEAEALMMNGQITEALSVAKDIMNSSIPSKDWHKRAEALHNYINDRIFPVTNWLSGEESNEINTSVTLDGLRTVISKQTKPLVEWWRTFQSVDGKQANSEMFDVWGRGAFSRIITAIQIQPSQVIVVDATTVNEVAQWARIFCPFYDIVIVKWKGPLQACLVTTPMPDYLGTRGTFGGQGYVRTNAKIDKEGYHVALGWANIMPVEVTTYLGHEAINLIEAGRLLVLPASLIGCSQSNSGWTDNMFADHSMRGVTSVVKKTNRSIFSQTKSKNRIIDVSDIAIPFIDNISLKILNEVLDDTADWLKPMRRMLKNTIGSSGFRDEKWEPLNPIFEDLHDATREYRERLVSLTKMESGKNWTVRETVSSISATPVDYLQIGSEPVTDMLRSIAGKRPDLGHWIPYWRLKEAGGEIRWSGILNNQSHEPDAKAIDSLAMLGAETKSPQSWWYPGSGGPGIGASFKF